MDAEDLVIYNGGNWEAIKALNKLFPKLKRISPLAFIIESVYTIN
tara:strand:- start:610 stop:744 length:135 start_codon:yes stop_codon:yes gene_type:complete